MARMASAFIVSALLTCCCLVSCADPACDQTALRGADYSLPLNLKLDPKGRLKWTYNGTIIFHKRGESINPGKKEDISEDGSLKLRKVGDEHVGMYTAEVHSKEGESLGTFNPVQLCVQDSVKQPKVMMTCKSPDVIFSCSDKGEDGKVAWSQNGKVMKETSQSVKFVAEKVQKDKFTCKVSNKVSSSVSVAVIQNCYEPVINFPETLWGINIWIIIGGGGGFVLLLIIIVIVCCIKAKRRKRMHIKDEEEFRLGWTNPNQQQQHQHHHHHHPPNQRHHHHHHHEHQQHQHQHRQQPAGHTGPRPHRPKQQRQKKQPDQYSCQPQPSPRRPAQAPQPADEEKPPPLPQPRKKAPKTPQM